MMSNTRKPLAKTVKDTIDFVFEILTSNPGGYEMSASELGKTRGKVVAILVERGIIERNHACNGKKSRYKWAAAMAPTKVLYGSVTQELADRNREEKKRYYGKLKAKTSAQNSDNDAEEAVQKAVDEAPGEKVQAEGVETFEPEDQGGREHIDPLDAYTIEELWRAIKRRGGYIDGGQLAFTTYLD